MAGVTGKKVLLKDKSGEVIIPYVDFPQVAGRNIGDIFYTSRTDTELNGAVECNGATYSTSDFTGSQSIGNLLSQKKVPYVSLSEYASIVSSKGSCRAFGWDGGTSFRVPLLKDVYIEAGTASSAGEFISESLPDHTHGFGGSEIPLYASGSGRRADISGGDGGQRIWITATDGANNSTYKNGAKVKPDSVRYRAMVQLAIKATDEAVITATSALQQIGNKVDRNEADYVVESYSDGANWCRIYKSGWMEQGGNTQTSSTTNNSVITFEKPFKDTNYIVLALPNASSSAGSSFNDIDEKKTTGFTIRCSSTTYGFNWEAKGYYR